MASSIPPVIQERLAAWLPTAKMTPTPHRRADGVLVWQGPRGAVRWLLTFKNHLPQQDVHVLAARLEQLIETLPKLKTTTRVLLLAAYVPPKQAEFLRRRGIDYADDAGNAHLDAPGVLIHVEGKRPERANAKPGGITKGWVKVVLAGLLQPALFEGPYHALAAAAGVTAPTVMTCLRDLQRRGLLDARGRHRRTLIGRRELLPLWTHAYVNTLRPGLKERRFRLPKAAPEELLHRVQDVLKAHHIAWCTTGATAALTLTHYYQTDVIEIYAAPGTITDAVARELRAQPAPNDANLVFIEPPIPNLVRHAAQKTVAFPTAPALLAYAELRYAGTDQANDAAELLLPLIEAPHAAIA